MLFIACSRYISSISIIIVTNICLSFTRGHDSAQASQQITTTAHTHTHGSRVRATWLSRVVADMANKKSLFSNELSRIVVRIQNITPERPDIAYRVSRGTKRGVACLARLQVVCRSGRGHPTPRREPLPGAAVLPLAGAAGASEGGGRALDERGDREEDE